MPSPPASTNENARRPLRFFLRANALAVAVIAFFFWGFHLSTSRYERPRPAPEIAALAQAHAPKRLLEPFGVHLLREGEWNWPRGGRFFVLPDYNRLSRKSLRARPEAVRAANRAGADPPWDESPRPPLAWEFELACAAAWAADWWTLQLRLPLRPCFDRLSGRDEYGLAPLAVAALYETLSFEEGNDAYPLAGRGAIPWPEDAPRSLTARPFPCSLEAMGRLFEFAWRERATSGTLRRFDPPGWPGGGETLALEQFASVAPPRMVWPARPIDTPAQAAEAASILSKALRDHGVLLAGLRESRPSKGPDVSREGFSRHAAVVLGDYRIGGQTLFLLRSPSGFADNEQLAGEAFAMARPEALLGAIAFPHPLRARVWAIGDGAYGLSVADPLGRPLAINPARDLRFLFDCQYRSLGRGRWEVRPAPGQEDEDWIVEILEPFFQPADGAPVLARFGGP
ncbi:MAG: hypothetical protein BWZ10_02198 [candidate division BRC1 bacterium ADurb.BinA364]|nr:MAG: hypothetical protein BWZ10_02198 [candidate division BRC1 bacterium ADurb.BinA364]